MTLNSAAPAARVLIVSDSILDAPVLPAAIATHAPGAAAQLWTYGGSMSTMGMFVLADQCSRASRAYNQEIHSGINTWQRRFAVTLEPAQSPASGQTVWSVYGHGRRAQHVSAAPGRGSVRVGQPVLPIGFKATVEPGSLHSFGLLLYNATRRGVVAASYWQPSDISLLGNLPMPYLLQATPTSGIGYGPNDVLLPYFFPGTVEKHPGNMYVSDVGIHWGLDPGVTPSPTLSPALTSARSAPLFDLVVVLFGRNDAGYYAAGGTASGYPASPSPGEFNTIMTGLARAARNYAPRVLIATPPPEATRDLSGWSARDPYLLKGYLPAVRAAAASAGCSFFNAVHAFKEAASNGLALTALMRDPIHPTVVTPHSHGIDIYARAIAQALEAAPMPASSGSSITSYLAAERQQGNWKTETLVSGGYPGHDPSGLAIGIQRPYLTNVLVSSQPGAVLHYAVEGNQLGIVILANEQAPGRAEIALDGKRVTGLDSFEHAASNYPRGLYIPTDGTTGRRDLSITVVSGQVKVVGVVDLHI